MADGIDRPPNQEEDPMFPNEYEIEAFKTQVGYRLGRMELGPAIVDATWNAPGLRDHNLRQTVALVDAVFPGTGPRCCNCHRKQGGVKLRNNDMIACDDCAAWAGVQ